MGGTIFGIGFILFLIVGLYLYFNQQKSDRSSSEQALKNEIRKKYSFFYSALQDLNISVEEYKITVDELILKHDIRNEFKTLGRFYYNIKDKFEIGKNSVGPYKIHKYFIEVIIKVEPSFTIRYSADLAIENGLECKALLKSLIDNAEKDSTFLDALKLHEI